MVALVVPGLGAGAAHAGSDASGAKQRKSPSATTVKVALPAGGDITYAVAQVRVQKKGRTPKVSKRRRVYKGKVGGLQVVAQSRAWSRLRKTTKLHVIATTVAGGDKNLRNVAFFIVRKRGGKRATGSIAVTMPNAAANLTSFYVRKVSKRGVATVFQSRNALSTAIENWGRYLAALKAASAMKAAQNPVDVNGTFKARASQGGVRMFKGGHKMARLTKKMHSLIFGNLGDRMKYQAAKKDPTVTTFIGSELKNPRLAQQWAAIVAETPVMVPDQFAANAKEEAKFQDVQKASISQKQVVIRDDTNSSDIVVNDFGGGRYIRENLLLTKAGRGSGRVYSIPYAIDCESECVSAKKSFYSGQKVQLTAVPSRGSEVVGWEGCDSHEGEHRYRPDLPPDPLVQHCTLTLNASQEGQQREVKVNFGESPPPPPPPPPPPSGQFFTFGSDLSRAADSFESHQQDSVFWNTAYPDARSPVAPEGGQILEIRLKGAARRAPSGAAPKNDDETLRLQVLRPQSDGVMLVPAGGGTSAPFKIPLVATAEEAHQQVTTFRPENLCVSKGDSVAINTKGGWDETHLPQQGGYYDGIPFQIFGAGPGSSNAQFHKHNGTNNGARLENGVGDLNEPRKDPVVRQNQELLLQVTMGTGSNAFYMCPGGTHNPFRPKG